MRSLIASALTVLLVSPASAPVDAQASSPYPVRHEQLATLWRDELGDDYVSMGRTTIQPGAAMTPTRFTGDWVARIDTGELTLPPSLTPSPWAATIRLT
jgi:hypothetical protein